MKIEKHMAAQVGMAAGVSLGFLSHQIKDPKRAEENFWRSDETDRVSAC